jgi:hypothetical protein
MEATSLLLASGATTQRSFAWIFQRIITFFRGVYSFDKLEIKGTSDLFRESLQTSVKVGAILDRLFADAMRTLIPYSAKCHCVHLFEQFMINEYSVIDFQLFSVTFNAVYDFLYPPVSEMLENPDIEPEAARLYVHIDICQIIFNCLFREITPLNLDAIRKDTHGAPHVDLVDVFVFAEQLLMAFRVTHSRFHAQVRAILDLIQWDSSMAMTVSKFKQFFLFIDPLDQTHDFDTIWDRLRLEMEVGICARGKEPLSPIAIIKSCSTFPNVARAVLSLPFQGGFEQAFKRLFGPQLSIMDYLQRRFAQVIAPLYFEFSDSLRREIEKPMILVRDALIRCDVATALRGYRGFLQTLDLRMTVERPYLVLSPELSPEDVENLIGQFTAREALALSYFPNHNLLKDKLHAKAVLRLNPR